MSNLYPRQKEIVAACRSKLLNNENPLVMSPTGSGKGHIARHIMRLSASNGKTCIFIAPDVSIIQDNAEYFGDNCGIYCSSLGRKELKQITFASKGSIVVNQINKFDYVIIDEAHAFKDEWLSQITKPTIGFSATPWCEVKGFIYGPEKFFKDLAYKFSPFDAIREGLLCDYEIINHLDNKLDVTNLRLSRLTNDFDLNSFTLDEKVAHNQVLETLAICENRQRKKVAFLCINIEHAEMIASMLPENETVLIHSRIPDSRGRTSEFKSNDKLKYSVSVAMLSQGFDCPQIDTIVYLRPTRSVKLMLQSAGRGLRLFEGKDKCLLIDFGEVFTFCGEPKAPDLCAVILNTHKKKNKINEEEFIKALEEYGLLDMVEKDQVQRVLTPIRDRIKKSLINADPLQVAQIGEIRRVRDKNGAEMLKITFRHKLTKKFLTAYVHKKYNPRCYWPIFNGKAHNIEYKKKGNFYNVVKAF